MAETKVAMRILVADDDRSSRLLLARAIRGWGHQTVLAADGAEAWERLRERDGPRVAILDWMMPGVDGLDLCRLARGGDLPHYAYIILLSARTDFSDRLAGLEAGADDYLTKPANLEELRLRVNTACRIAELHPRLDSSGLHLMQVRQSYGELIRAHDAERSQIARELHEDIAQRMSGIAMTLASLHEAPAEACKRVPGLISTAQACVRDLQALSYTLHPPLLDEIGLAAALRAFAEHARRNPGMEVEIDIPSDFARLGREWETGLFRMAQEAVTHLRHHCGCSRGSVRIERGPNELRLEIVGEGGEERVCPDISRPENLEIRERAEQYGGGVEFQPAPGGGRITVVLPVS